MEKILELKYWLKSSGIEIRIMKSLFKEHQRKNYFNYSWGTKQNKEWFNNSNSLSLLKNKYRHMHIAYSELRGKTRSQIESSYPYNQQYVRSNYKSIPNEDWISKIKEEYTKKTLSVNS